MYAVLSHITLCVMITYRYFLYCCQLLRNSLHSLSLSFMVMLLLFFDTWLDLLVCAYYLFSILSSSPFYEKKKGIITHI